MNKFIRKNQKKLLAVFGAFLMVVFVIGLAPRGFNSGPPQHVAGTLDGVKVLQTSLLASNDEWKLLVSLPYPDPQSQEGYIPLPLAELGPAANVINANPTTFYLLVQEARKQGLVANSDLVQDVLKKISSSPELADDPDRVTQAITDLLLVRNFLLEQADVVKMSEPLRRWVLARTRQLVSLDVVMVPASKYLSKVAAPTDAQIQNQYDRYSDQAPGNFGDKNDPFGFGYLVPNRVKVQYLTLNHDAVRAAAIASRSDLDWHVAAFSEFQAHRDHYDAEPIPLPDTRPAATGHNTTTRGATQASAKTHMAATRADVLDTDFQLHVGAVLDDLYNQETDKLQDTILKRIDQLLNSGYGVWHEAQMSSAASQASTRPQANGYISMAYLANVCKTIQKQFGVLPTVSSTDSLKSRDELNKLPGIGDADLMGVKFSRYAIDLFKPFATDQVKNSAAGAYVLALGQPSNPLTDEQQNGYIFRISDSDPAHPAAFNDVKKQVVADFKLSAAYDLATADAKSLVADAENVGLEKAAQLAKLPSPVATDLFLPADILDSQNPSPSISPLNLDPTSARELAEAAQQLLTATPGSNGRPASTADLYPDATVAAIELRQAAPEWDTTDPGPAENDAAQSLWSMQITNLLGHLCDYATVAERAGYTPVNPRQEAQQ